MQSSAPKVVHLSDAREQRRRRELARLDRLLKPAVVEAVLELINAEIERQ